MWHAAGLEPARRRVSGWRAACSLPDLEGKIKNTDGKVAERKLDSLETYGLGFLNTTMTHNEFAVSLLAGINYSG